MIRRSFLVALALAASACLQLDPQVFMPLATTEYYLPDNRIPADQLEQVEIDAVTVDLAGLWATREDPSAAPTVLFCEGEIGNLDFHWRKVMNIWDAGFNVLAFDYRGYGMSSGETTEAGLYLDAEAALAFLAERDDLDPERIVFWGYSMGAAVAADLAIDETPAALVLEAPFTNVDDLIEGASPLGIPGDWVTPAEFSTIDKVPAANGPVLVTHGARDKTAPLWMGEAVFAAALEPKVFVEVAEGRHDNLLKKAKERIFAALADLAPALEASP